MLSGETEEKKYYPLLKRTRGVVPFYMLLREDGHV